MSGSAAPLLSVRNASKQFGTFKALDGVSLSVARGQRIVVCGPSGSGKSTLIRCINGLETLQGGTVVIDGAELSQDRASLIRLRRDVGMVFQHFNLFPHLSVLENCVLAPMKVRGEGRAE